MNDKLEYDSWSTFDDFLCTRIFCKYIKISRVSKITVTRY